MLLLLYLYFRSLVPFKLLNIVRYCYCSFCIVFTCLYSFLFKFSFCICFILNMTSLLFHFHFLTCPGFNQKRITRILDIVFITRTHIFNQKFFIMKFIMELLVLRFLIGWWSVVPCIWLVVGWLVRRSVGGRLVGGFKKTRHQEIIFGISDYPKVIQIWWGYPSIYSLLGYHQICRSSFCVRKKFQVKMAFFA